MTLRVWVEEDGAQVGEVFAPSQVVPGAVVKLTAPEPMPASRAARTAFEVAASRGLELVVADPDDIWDGIPTAPSDRADEPSR
ncbi:hypothetical protein GXW71_10385 [Roseomonas hellenica]|uniref:Uncharacterized protein n=1 Tax=Plastoroseomonas hellenica TaxID=2687306 RepID=A0ABS5EWS3_9PROT|nr:hypothetical protein [Plastoroseomonas hellenica]MBR0664758.1 hypothetical protein [Plastoroseomonas hellenica]